MKNETKEKEVAAPTLEQQERQKDSLAVEEDDIVYFDRLANERFVSHYLAGELGVIGAQGVDDDPVDE